MIGAGFQSATATAAIPTGRMGQPEEIAHAVAGFLDARAGYTTGQMLNICGGLTIGAAI